MKKNLSAISIFLATLAAMLFSSSLIAKTINRNSSASSKIEALQEKITEIFSKDYNAELLNNLMQIESALKNNNMPEVQERAKEVASSLTYYRDEAKKHQNENVKLSNSYQGDKVLYVKYGSWFNSKEMLLPLTTAVSKDKTLKENLVQNNLVLTPYFHQNEISSAKIKYVSFNTDSEKFRKDLNNLLASIEENDKTAIRENINDIYDDMIIEHNEKISLVSKIRDNLVIANFLNESNQYKAADGIIGVTDSLVLKLIEATANSPAQQEKIKELRRDIRNTSKISDENYISQWEKIPDEIENMFNKAK